MSNYETLKNGNFGVQQNPFFYREDPQTTLLVLICIKTINKKVQFFTKIMG